jgi:phosphoribosyl-ATP pyrophosphohydrolase
VALASIIGIKDNTKKEAADLLFHLLVLLKQCDINLPEVLSELQVRRKLA